MPNEAARLKKVRRRDNNVITLSWRDAAALPANRKEGSIPSSSYCQGDDAISGCRAGSGPVARFFFLRGGSEFRGKGPRLEDEGNNVAFSNIGQA
jgi:hypothetical protein